jgi:hypothetical protein
MTVATDEVVRFWSKVNKDGPVFREDLGPCWIWTGTLDKDGYGFFHLTTVGGAKRKMVRAHRYAYNLEHESIASELFACHHCDNPPCVRPSHIYPGTAKQNSQQSVKSGRFIKGDRAPYSRNPERYPRGSQKIHSKLTEDIVRDVRARAAQGIAINALAREYGVDFNTIKWAVNRTKWKHVV